MNIILEGLDNTGKSAHIQSIIKAFQDKYFHYLHYSALPVDDVVEYSKGLYRNMFDLMNVSSQNGINLLLDRAHLGEWVYGKIYRNYDAHFVFDIEKEHQYCEFMKHTYLIVLIDEHENLVARDDGLSFSLDKEQKEFEKERFVNAYEKSYIPNKLLINCNDYNCNLEVIFQQILIFLEGGE